jgi:hypothetical protein
MRWAVLCMRVQKDSRALPFSYAGARAYSSRDTVEVPNPAGGSAGGRA